LKRKSTEEDSAHLVDNERLEPQDVEKERLEPQDALNETPRKRLRLDLNQRQQQQKFEEIHESQQQVKFSKKKAMANRYRHGNFDGYYSYRITDDLEADPR